MDWTDCQATISFRINLCTSRAYFNIVQTLFNPLKTLKLALT